MMKEGESSSGMPASDDVATQEAPGFVPEFHGVRYQVKDVARSVAFYTQHLGFKPGHQQLPAFANVSLGRFTCC
jgi:glyoxylase I family protein